MSSPDFDSANPYQSPASDLPPPGTKIQMSPGAKHFKMVKDFRNQIHALGGFWIFIGAIVLIVGGVVLGGLVTEAADPETMIGAAVVFGGLGAMWLGLGVMACLKQMWAVYIGLVLSYLSLIGNLLRFNVCGLVILGAVVLQAHRVIGWAGELRRAGIPLTTRPKDILMPLSLPSDLPGPPPPPQWPT